MLVPCHQLTTPDNMRVQRLCLDHHAAAHEQSYSHADYADQMR